jgi:hypothetical protein
VSQGGVRPSRRRAFLDWKGVLGILVSAALLYYAFRGVHLREVVQQVWGADPLLLGLAALAATLVFPLRALRWKPLLEPVHPSTRFRPRFAATCIGFMANNLLPARVGEFARAYALSRLEPVRASASFGSLVVERMFDGLVVVGLLLVTMAAPGFPDVSGRDFGAVAFWVGLVFLAVFGLMLLVVSRPERSVRAIERVATRLLPGAVRRPIVDALAAFLQGIAAVRDWRLVLRALGWSLLVWGTNGMAFWLAFLAFDIDAPLVAAFFLQSLIALAVAIPSAPGFFGVFEAGARIGLVEVWGIESANAVAFAIGFHIAGFIPVTLMGLYYLWRLGLSWGEVESSEEAVETAVEAGSPATGEYSGP